MLQAIQSLFKSDHKDSSSNHSKLQSDAHLLQTTLKLVSTALLLMIYMPKQILPQERLTTILQEQQKLVSELKAATPSRILQIQAEIVSLTEEQSELLQEAGAFNCFIFSSSSTRGTGWIEEERNYDGSVRQYRYGYYQEGKSKRRYLPKSSLSDVQQMIASGAKPQAIIEFLEQTKKRSPKTSLIAVSSH